MKMSKFALTAMIASACCAGTAFGQSNRTAPRYYPASYYSYYQDGAAARLQPRLRPQVMQRRLRPRAATKIWLAMLPTCATAKAAAAIALEAVVVVQDRVMAVAAADAVPADC